jgi:hypothetical protein
MPSARWARLLLDADRLVAEGWTARALQLGWDARDLFGCHPEKPCARISHQGLVWLLNGRKIVALCADTAALTGAGGGRLVYHRQSINPDCVLVWTLKELRDDGAVMSGHH